jgi:hypothetical protein
MKIEVKLASIQQQQQKQNVLNSRTPEVQLADPQGSVGCQLIDNGVSQIS